MIVRPVVVIPTYNNANSIEAVILDCLLVTPYPVRVIDDGSTRAVQGLLKDTRVLDALKSGHLKVIRNEINEGKGVALQKAISLSVREGFTHMITIDGDGQHFAREIDPVMREAQAHPWALVIGCRKLQGDTVPGSTLFGRRFSNFWVRYETGLLIRDSQSGFRVYPLFHVQNMKFWTKRYDFEIEVLIRLLWRKVSVREVDIDVYYPRPENRVSHFRKWVDNTRISLLNIALVFLSLLRAPASARALALAVGLGVFIGCTPFFGFHALLALGVSFFFQLNALVVLAGTQISIPPLAPFLAGASVIAGKRWGTGQPWTQWLLGSLIVGACLGAAAGCATFLIARLKRAKKIESWNGRTRGGVFGNWFMKSAVQLCGKDIAHFFLKFIIPYFYLFAPRARRAHNEYWKILAPDLTWWQRQKRILKHHTVFAQTLLDRVDVGARGVDLYRSHPHGMHHIVNAEASQKGTVLLTAHVGSWDMASALLWNDGFSSDFHSVQYFSTKGHFNKLAGFEVGERAVFIASNQEEQPLLHVYERLSSGKVVGLMADRPLGGNYENVPFFGKLAPFDITPFRVGIACRAQMIATFGFKAGAYDYDFFATPPRQCLREAHEDKNLACLRWSSWFAQCLERHLLKHPYQWFNFFPFWSEPPAAPTFSTQRQAEAHLRQEGSPQKPGKLELESAATASV